ncbi:MAG: hypothetical protein D9C04_02570 [Nitrosopumilus sp. B06]|nr:MAG: hypothetical protein D9C04_02570 [Nitrosopumilus sp. B06]
MMLEFHFKNHLKKENIDQTVAKFGFKNSVIVEKLFMDFEILFHIQKLLPDGIVKGGVATLFHLQDDVLRRLSNDIDIVTSQSKSEVIEIMKKVTELLKGKIHIEQHIPKRAHDKVLPLLTYNCNYKSAVLDNQRIKIDIFYQQNMDDISVKYVNQDVILDFPIDFEVSIYELSTLIGDKLTTLPRNTVGIQSDRERDIPKQIFDIASLIKKNNNDVSINVIAKTFKKIVKEEISYIQNNKPPFDDVLDDFDGFTKNLLMSDQQLKLNRSYEGQFNKFVNEMLGNHTYTKNMHITDILLIDVIVKLLIKGFNGMSHKEMGERLERMLRELKMIPNEDKSEIQKKNKNLTKGYRQKNPKYSGISFNILEHAYLFNQIFEIENA